MSAESADTLTEYSCIKCGEFSLEPLCPFCQERKTMHRRAFEIFMGNPKLTMLQAIDLAENST